jgi:Family of unknown function (DUF6788)
MIVHKTQLSALSTRVLLTRRRRLVARLGEVEQVLAGSLVEQTRRCGKPDCRCPYVYLSPRPHGRGRLRYVPADLVAAVRARLRRGEQVQAVLAEISAINLELLARRDLN